MLHLRIVPPAADRALWADGVRDGQECLLRGDVPFRVTLVRLVFALVLVDGHQRGDSLPELLGGTDAHKQFFVRLRECIYVVTDIILGVP